jgi:hypothetical protein
MLLLTTVDGDSAVRGELASKYDVTVLGKRMYMRRTKSIKGCANSSNDEPAETFGLPGGTCCRMVVLLKELRN